MRVMHIIGDGNPGGGPVVVESLCTGMLARGVETVIVTQTDSYFFKLSREKGWKTFGLDFRHRRDSLRISREILALIGHVSPDVIHAHGARSALPLSLLPRHKRPAFVYTIHGFHYDQKGLASRQFFKLIEKVCIRSADQVVVVGKADEAFARNEGLVTNSRGWSLIYNGVELPDGCTISSEPAFDVAFVGRLHRQKNPLVLPAIMAAMKRPQVTMLIVGGGELEAELRENCKLLGVEAQITMVGSKSRVDAIALMSQARIFVLPSLWEGVPVVLVEAMKLGLPIVASRIPGNQELIHDGETGLLADPLAPEEFANQILSLLDSRDAAESLARNAMLFASKTWSIDSQVDAHVRVYQTAIATARTRR